MSCGRSSSSRTAVIRFDTASTEVKEMSSFVRRSLMAALVFSMANGSAPLASWLLSSAHFFSYARRTRSPAFRSCQETSVHRFQSWS